MIDDLKVDSENGSKFLVTCKNVSNHDSTRNKDEINRNIKVHSR
jgi:hypothetical protein